MEDTLKDWTFSFGLTVKLESLEKYKDWCCWKMMFRNSDFCCCMEGQREKVWRQRGWARRVLTHSKHKSNRKQGKMNWKKNETAKWQTGWGLGAVRAENTLCQFLQNSKEGERETETILFLLDLPNPVFFLLINLTSFESTSFASTTQTVAKVLARDLQSTRSPPLRTLAPSSQVFLSLPFPAILLCSSLFICFLTSWFKHLFLPMLGTRDTEISKTQGAHCAVGKEDSKTSNCDQCYNIHALIQKKS